MYFYIIELIFFKVIFLSETEQSMAKIIRNIFREICFTYYESMYIAEYETFKYT